MTGKLTVCLFGERVGSISSASICDLDSECAIDFSHDMMGIQDSSRSKVTAEVNPGYKIKTKASVNKPDSVNLMSSVMQEEGQESRQQ